MKRVFIALLLLINIANAQTITDTTQLRSAINTDIVANSVGGITATKLNRILQGNINALSKVGLSSTYRSHDSIFYIKAGVPTFAYKITVGADSIAGGYYPYSSNPKGYLTNITGTLNAITTAGNTTLNDIHVGRVFGWGDLAYIDDDGHIYAASFDVRSNGFIGQLNSNALSADRDWTLPDSSGYLALTSQLLNISNSNLKLVGTSERRYNLNGYGQLFDSGYVKIRDTATSITAKLYGGYYTFSKSGIDAITYDSSTTSGLFTIGQYAKLYYNDHNNLDSNTNVTVGVNLLLQSAKDIRLGTQSATAMTIQSTGKVGIGTGSPSEALHIVGNLRLVNGSQAAGLVLKSDANGVSTWSKSITTLAINTTDAGNLAADIGGTNLMSYTIPAGQLANDGDYIEFTMTFVFASNTNDKQVQLHYGGTNFYLSGVQGQEDGSMEIKGTIVRTSSHAERITFSQVSNSSLFADESGYEISGETLSGAIVLRAVGEGEEDSDVIQKILIVKYFPAN